MEISESNSIQLASDKIGIARLTLQVLSNDLVLQFLSINIVVAGFFVASHPK